MAHHLTFSAADREQMNKLGIDMETVFQQMEILSRGNRFVWVHAPAVRGNGINVYDEETIEKLVKEFEHVVKNKKLLKFIPASGAATRMFKDLFQVLEPHTLDNTYLSPAVKNALALMQSLKQTAFYDRLKATLYKHNLHLERLLDNKDYVPVIKYLLDKEGMHYAALPKGLLLFHSYENENRTAFEEHFVEGSAYAKNSDGQVHLHFTISPEHKQWFENLLQEVKQSYEQRFNVSFKVDFSFQSPATNTLSLTEDNDLFRNEDGSLEFRPGGHGSLLENLSNVDADVVFIKNIDNVTVDARKADTILYKKLLSVLLLNMQEQCFAYLRMLESPSLSLSALAAIEGFAQEQLHIVFPGYYASMQPEEKQAYLFRQLNRPIRVCGMVKRENEPGGGPFWAGNASGQLSLQIVETSEIDLSDPEQESYLEASEYFNPVDLVCGLKNYKGEKFNLQDYADKERCFVTIKSKNGKVLKALEHPGLWNGAMSDWISIFVAVPLSTFTPVKTINDLLRKEHRQ